MVVGDNEVDAALLGPRGGLKGGHAAVDGDDEPRPVVRECVNGLGADPVAFFQAVRDVEVRLVSCKTEAVP